MLILLFTNKYEYAYFIIYKYKYYASFIIFKYKYASFIIYKIQP